MEIQDPKLKKNIRKVLDTMKNNNSGSFCSNDSSTLNVLNLNENLREIARKNPDGIAIEALNRAPLSYRRLVGHVEKGVAQLNSFGVGS